MIIETQDATYDVAINVAQIEITNKCNMCCLHCRGKQSGESNVQGQDMPIWAIIKIIQFAKDNSDNNLLEIVLSGGEPLLHPEIEQILAFCDNNDLYKEVTTNGSLIDEHYIDVLKKFNITNMSVSLDGASQEVHDHIRQCQGAFDKAINAINLMLVNNINTRIRTTISKSNIKELGKVADLAIQLGVKCLAVGPMMPVGNAITRTDDLFMSKFEMRDFLNRFYEVRSKYSGSLDIITNECLHNLRYFDKVTDFDNRDNIIIDGCTAGVVTFMF